jgi:hypothetical protein
MLKNMKNGTKEFINSLLTELSIRNVDGMPNLKREDDLQHIYQILIEWGFPYSFTDSFIQSLTEAEVELSKTAKSIINSKGLTHMGYGYYGKDDEAMYKKNEKGDLVPSTDDSYKKDVEDQQKKAGNVDKKKDGKRTTPQTKPTGGEEGPEPTSVFKTSSGAAYIEDLPDNDPAKIKKLDNKESIPDYKGKKNKKLKNTSPTQSEEYTRELEPDDDTFEKKNEKSSNPIPPPHVKLDGIIKNPKFPKRYIKAIERMLNSRATSETAKWSHFSDIPGGAGKISAQAGELITMMGSTMSDDEWNQFKKTILDYETELIKNNPNLKKPANRIIDKSWVDAADKSRTVIQNRLKKKYGDDVEIVAGAWDSKEEVEAMGLENYKENKGFSTDVYFRVKTADGTEILDEVSLKKSKDVNFLNSGAGKFEEWDDNLPDDINQNIYRDTQRKRNNSFIAQNRDEVDKFLNSPEGAEVIKEMERKGLTFEDAIKGDSRDKQKILWLCAVEMAKRGNDNAKKVVIEADKAHKEFQEKAINAIATNEKMKEGMLQTIKEEFPLKSVSDGEETMAIGDMSLDKDTMKEIFGTSDYDEIKEKLVAEPGPPPFLGYRAEVGSDVIPIAEVAIREDGVGYGGQIKFEMKLDKRFADRLKSATKSVYG